MEVWTRVSVPLRSSASAGQCVHHRRQHSHVIGGCAHAVPQANFAPPDVACSENHGNLDTHILDLSDLLRQDLARKGSMPKPCGPAIDLPPTLSRIRLNIGSGMNLSLKLVAGNAW